MIGTLINAGLIILGTAIGLFIRKGIPQRVKSAIMMGMGLATMLIGISGAIKTTDTLCVIVCIALGGMIGSAIDLEKQLEKLGNFAEDRLSSRNLAKGNISQGFVTASMIYCVGAMAIVGAIDSGIRGDHTTLIAKGIIDGVTAIVFASTMGIGVGFSALAVFLYQGAIALLSSWISPILTETVINEMGAVGNLLVIGIGLNLLYPDKHIPVANLLPAIFLPIAYLPLVALWG